MLDFIRREKLYIAMLFFIMAVNILNHGQAGATRTPEVKSSLSSKTFEEAGITEEKIRAFFESGRQSARFFDRLAVFGIFVFIFIVLLNVFFMLYGRKIEFEGLSFSPHVAWGMADLLRAVIVIGFTGYIIAIIEALILRLSGFNIGENLHMMFGTFFLDLSAVVVVVYFAIVKYTENMGKIGLRFSSFLKSVFFGISMYIFMLPVLIAVLLISVKLMNMAGYSPPPQPVLDVLMEEKNNKVLLFLGIFISMFGPLAEEIFFRGFMYSALRKRLGVFAGMFVSAAIFSLLHANPVGFLPIMVLGMLLAYLYEKTGSLAASVTVHMIHNFILVMFVFFIKELMAG